MTLQVEFWTLVSVSITLLGAVVGLFWAMIRNLIGQSLGRLNERFEMLVQSQRESDAELARRLELIDRAMREESTHSQRIERELYQLKAELPERYVQRDDYVRGQSTIMAKLDALAMKVDNANLRAALAAKDAP
jgi:tetrahydromethanopterin S-methyltransferase subunit G